MEIKRGGSRPSAKGSADWFTGEVPIDPGEKHWHGASPANAMTHIAIQEKLNGKAVDWMEHGTDEQNELNRPPVRKQSCEELFSTVRATCVSRSAPRQESSNRPTPSSRCRPPASAARTCGRTVGSIPSQSPRQGSTANSAPPRSVP